jgi:hypothetical protein
VIGWEQLAEEMETAFYKAKKFSLLSIIRQGRNGSFVGFD